MHANRKNLRLKGLILLLILVHASQVLASGVHGITMTMGEPASSMVDASGGCHAADENTESVQQMPRQADTDANNCCDGSCAMQMCQSMTALIVETTSNAQIHHGNWDRSEPLFRLVFPIEYRLRPPIHT